MSCFGRINDDIYNNKYNVRFRPDGSIVVIRTIFPGDELVIDYGDDYKENWNWVKQDALQGLVDDILTRFPFVSDLSSNITLDELSNSNHPLQVAIRDIISGDAWRENLHSLTVDSFWSGSLGLSLFLTAGSTFEKYRFGGWGSGKSYTESNVKRGQLGLFCDSWNGSCTASIDPKILLSPGRKNNGC
jgi:hypothetical protein